MRPQPDTRTSPSPFASRGGFALLITITLLAFIVILLLGLAVYTRVETSIAGNMQRQSQARENALFGLNVALSQLQKHAGPDTRATATAANFGAVDGTRYYSGVWSHDATKSAPLTWLVSGNEVAQPDIPDPDPNAPEGSMVPAPLAVTPAQPGTRLQNLVGRNSTGDAVRSANWVDAPLVDVTATGVPGVSPTAPPAVVGRYAWWVGDQGVKAPVAVADTTSAITFAPFNSPELQGRLRQQLPLGSGAVDGDGAPIFEPRDANNTDLVANGKVAAANQFAFLRTGTNTQVGLARVQQNFHTWSPNNFAVLSDTMRGGLRQDLSLVPTLLGAAFAAWANYPAYMEKFTPTVAEEPPVTGSEVPAEPVATITAPAILPAYSADPVRRRYVVTPHQLEADIGGSHQVAPVLNYFLLTFNVRTKGDVAAERSLEVRARWMMSLWNPYTSALVPENLRLEISGLPNSVRVVNDTSGNTTPIDDFSLRSLYGSPLRVNLPWDSSTIPEGQTGEDRRSWLPGRIYTWRSNENSSGGSSPPSEGYESSFYSQSLNLAGAGVQRDVTSGVTIAGNDECHLEVSGGEQLIVTLYAVRSDGDVRLGRFMSPAFVESFITKKQPIRGGDYQFSYVFRLAESIDTPAAPATWLTTEGRDIRRRTVPSEAFVVAENGNDPAQYGESYSRIRNPDRLFDRGTDSLSYNEDVPLFELPRAPLLSIGALQHFRLVGQRPFMIGNPWGNRFELNGFSTGQLFDRFFFSGVTDGVVPSTSTTGDLMLPNTLLKPLRKSDGTKVTAGEVRPAPVVEVPPSETTPPAPVEEPPVETPVDPAVVERIAATRTSAHFLHGGAFNLNSTNATAWAAVLRSVRFPAPQSFTYLNASAATGTAEDTATNSVQSDEAQFFRFSQSAQETYKAEPGLADNDPNAVSPANTHLFRKGMRTLSATEVSAFAAKIVELMGVKHAALEPQGGPFRSLEEFLAPSALFAGVDADGNPLAPRSLLEAAIADAGINTAIPEFSSQWLTQGDVMTALAPILFPRSDTFVIRSYGEAVNPATTAVEGRAWAEAIVQRVPEYFDPSVPPETPLSAFEPVLDPNDPTLPPTSTQSQDLNKLYGRRFKIISFRWLTRSDI